MKPSNPSLRSWLLALTAGTVISSTLTVRAVEYTWDSAATAGIQSGAGNWATTAPNWTVDGGATRIGWPNTGTDSAVLTGATTLNINSTDIQLDDFTTTYSTGFGFLNQLNAGTRTLTLTGGTHDGTGTTGSQFNIASGGGLSFAGTAGTTQIFLAGSSDLVKVGGGSLFFAAGSINNTFTGKLYLKSGFTYINSGNDSSLGNVENDIYISNGALSAQTNAVTLGSGRTIHLVESSSARIGAGVAMTLQGQITGLGSLDKIGTSTLTIEAASDYSGTTTITAGTLRLGVNGTIPSSSNLTINGGATSFFNIRNTNNWVYNGNITGDGTGSITPNSGTNATLAGTISGVASISASTAGTNATISGDISGATTVSVTNAGASLRLSGTNSYSGATTVGSGGTLIVNGNNSGAIAPVTVNAGGTLAGSGTIGSATLVTGTHAPGGVSGVQTFNLGIDYLAASTLAVNIGTNSSAIPARGAFPLGYGAADVTAGTINVDPAATGRVALNSATGDLNLSNPFWNTPQQWLVVDVKGTAFAADANVPVSAGATLNGSAFNTAAYGTFSFFRADGSTPQDSVWLQWIPSTPPTWTGASGPSWATAGNWTPAAPATGDIVRFHTASTSNLNTVLGADFDLLGLAVINPSGPVSVGGANILTLGSAGIDLAFATRNLTITAPVILSAAQSWTAASGRTISVNGGVSGAFPLTVSGAGTLSLGAAVDPLVAMTVSPGATLKMGASGVLSSDPTAVNGVVNGTLDLNGTTQSVNALGGSGIIDNTAAGASVLTVGNNDAAVTLNATLQNTNGPLALAKNGTSALTINSANTFSGGFTNNGTGDLLPKTNTAFGSGAVVMNTGTLYAVGANYTFANSLALNGAILRVGGGANYTVTWNGPVIATGASGINADGGTGGITLGSTLDITGATFTSFANATTNNILGNVSGVGGSLEVTSGTLQLAGTNSYTGTTTLSGSAVLRLQPTGTISNSSNIVINGTSNFNVRNTVGWVYNGTITGEGTGQVNLNSGTNATLTGNISGVATVNANSIGTDTTVSGVISGAANVNVQGSAILRLSGGNNYTGATNVTAGTLVLAASNVLPDATAVTIGNATLDAATFADTAGTLDVSSTATIHLGTGATLAFADSKLVDWTGGSLNITGPFVSGSSLRFGTVDDTGLTDAQLLQITAAGFTGFDLNSSGYLIATSTGGFSAWQSANSTAGDLGDDHDLDGVTNGIEYFLFGNTNSTGFTTLPGVVNTGGTLSVTWTKAATGYTGTYGTDFVVETSSTLVGTWTPATLGVGAGNVEITGDAVKYTFPAGTRIFARLKVTGP